jgi:hypothetical protein
MPCSTHGRRCPAQCPTAFSKEEPDHGTTIPPHEKLFAHSELRSELCEAQSNTRKGFIPKKNQAFLPLLSVADYY